MRILVFRNGRSRLGRAAVLLGVLVGLTVQPVVSAEVYALPDSGNMVDFRGQDGATGLFEVTGATDGEIFGTSVYTDDSDVATAAVHAGIVRPGETRDLTIEIVGSKSKYRGSSSHGIVSGDFGSWSGSYKFLDTPEADTAVEVLPDPGTLKGYRNQMGRTLNFTVIGTTSGVIYGDGIYTDDSQLATAAVHAGVLAPGEQGTVSAVIMPGLQHYIGVQRNNVYSGDFGAWSGSFRFAGTRAAPDGAMSDPGNMQDYRGRNGQMFRFMVVGDGKGAIYGDGIYTDDTHIAQAAVHAGLLRDGEAGVVAVEVLPGQEHYNGSTRNGVTSLSFNHWEGSYQFVP